VTNLGCKLVRAANREQSPYKLEPAINMFPFWLKPRAASISMDSLGVNEHSPSDLRSEGEGNMHRKLQLLLIKLAKERDFFHHKLNYCV